MRHMKTPWTSRNSTFRLCVALLGENVNISGKKFVKLAPEYRKIYNKLWYKMNAKELSEFIKEDGKIDYKQISQDSFLLYY